MMRPHCDRCEKLCGEYPMYVDCPQLTPVGAERLAHPDTPDTFNRRWHIDILDPHFVRHTHEMASMFCRRCRIEILEEYIKALKKMTTAGGHLVDCVWDAANLQYVCVDGCEIKRLNEGVYDTTRSE